MQRHIPSSALRTIRDLLAGNDLASTDPAAHLLDLLLRNALWNNQLVEDAAALLADSGVLAAWRPRYRVRKREFAASDPVQIPELTGPGSVINPPDPWHVVPGGGRFNYFVILQGQGLTVDPLRGVEIDFDVASSGYAEAEQRQLPLHSADGVRVLSDEASIRSAASTFFSELGPGGGPAFLMFNSPTPLPGGEGFGTFPVPVTAYVAIPRPGVIDFPRWFVDAPWSEVGDVEIVDRRLKIGGGAGGVAAYLGAEGRTEVTLPQFVGPVLAALAVDGGIRFTDPLVVGEFAADSIDERAPLPFEALAFLALPFLGVLTLPAAFALGSTQIAQIRNLAVDPARGIGGLDLRVAERSGRPALAASLTFESIEDAIHEIEVTGGPDFEIERLDINVYFLPEIRTHRLEWTTEVEVTAEASPAVSQSIEDAVQEVVSAALDPQLLTIPLSILVGLPVLSGDTEFPDEADDQDTLGTGATLLFNLLDRTEWKHPVLPSSVFPMNLLAIVQSLQEFDLQRVTDRFVRYDSITVAPDPDESGSLRLEIEFEPLSQHGRENRLSHEVVPREGFEIRPLQLRLDDQEKPFQEWMLYLQSGLGRVLNRLRRERRATADLGLPKLHLDYTMSTEHDALPGGAALVWERQETHTLIDLPATPGAPGESELHHFVGHTLRPPTTAHPLLLELSSTLHGEQPSGDVEHVGRLVVEGSARLEYWRPKGPSGCASVLFRTFFEALERRRARRARQQSSSSNGTPGSHPLTEEVFALDHEEVTLELGEFGGTLDVDAQTGFELAGTIGSNRGNVLTASGSMLDIDLALERTTLANEDLDWLIVSFEDFQVQPGPSKKEIGEPDESDPSHPLSALDDGRRFEIVALVNGAEIGRAPFALRPVADRSVAAIGPGQSVELGGGQWATSLYFSRPGADTDSFDVKLEIRTGTGLVEGVQETVVRRETGAWADQREWGIPIGVPSTTLRITNNDNTLTANVRLRNRLPTTDVPIEHIPKRLEVELERVTVRSDLDPLTAGEGELEYRLAVQRISPEDHYTTVGSTRKFIQASTGDVVELDASPVVGDFKPDSHLVLIASGREYDNPGFPWFNPHDWLEKKSIAVPVSFDDSIDGERKILSWSDYELITEVHTRNRPPEPVLELLDPGDMSFKTAVSLEPGHSATQLHLKVATSWTNRLFLRMFDEGEEHPREPWTELIPAMPLGRYGPLPPEIRLQLPSGTATTDFVYYYTIPSVPTADVRFQLLASSVAGSVVSPEVSLAVLSS